MDAMCLVDIGVKFLARYIVPLDLPNGKCDLGMDAYKFLGSSLIVEMKPDNGVVQKIPLSTRIRRRTRVWR